ncbi:MAG: hypothetical protein HeimC2_23540 [Candidatus Heimdallarchaeota archaeon LC_2]|nr:MAG: hypothetical protein HeimC2_23540 [Candidatus Heimdallarchaeota archaeon LC_2]
MTFVKTILSDLDLMEIQYDEHYDPGGNLLFELYIRDSGNPLMIYSSQNPYNVLITFSVNYSHPNLTNIDIFERLKLKSQFKELGSKLMMRHILRLEENSIIFTIGIILNSKYYSPNELKPAIENLMKSYDLVMKQAIAIIQEL